MAQARRLYLPWAANRWLLGPGHVAAADGDLNNLLVQDVKPMAKHNPFGQVWETPDEHRRRAQGIMPWAKDNELPLSPSPSLDEQDRGTLNEDHLMGAAVALDVMASSLRPLDSGPTLLAAMVETLLAAAERGGLDDACRLALLADAASKQGDARALLSKQLLASWAATVASGDAAAGQTALAEAPKDDPQESTSLEAVALAQERIGNLAQALIHAVRLRLAALETLSYTQA